MWWNFGGNVQKLYILMTLKKKMGTGLQMDQRFSLATIKSYHMIIVTTQAHFTTMVTQTELNKSAYFNNLMIQPNALSPTTNYSNLCRKLNLRIYGGQIISIFLLWISADIVWQIKAFTLTNLNNPTKH